MARTSYFLVFALSLLVASTATGQVLINEVDSDTPGTDAAEFVELYDGGAGSTDLTGMVLVFFNGNDDQSYEPVFDLDGFSTDANGFFVICGDAANVANCDLEVGAGTTDMIQNGADAVALYTGDAADFPNDSPITTTDLIDALVYDTGDADDAALLVLLNGGQPQIDEDGSSSKDDDSMQRVPDGADGARNTTGYSVAAPSPGATNLRTIVEFELAGDSQDESAGTLSYDVTIANPDATNATDVDVVLTGGSAINGTDISMYNTTNLTFPAGSSTSLSFSVTFTDDGDAEFTEDLIFELQNVSGGTSAEIGTNSEFTLNILDNDSAPPAVFINEIDSDSPGTDAAEFIELYDGGTGNTDLTGMVVVMVNGSDDLTYEPVWDLDGQSTDVNGFFVICGDALNVANCDLEVGAGTTNLIQNGADAVAIYTGDAADFPNDTAPSTVDLIDALAYDTDESDDAGLLAALGLVTQHNENGNGDKDNHSVSRFPDGDNNVLASLSTPGEANTDALPVELTSFDATINGSIVLLTWRTATETNNAGFEVQHRPGHTNETWSASGFVDGAGTTSSGRTYQFELAGLETGRHRFRLKQIDFDGSFVYTPEIEIEVEVAGSFLLQPAYPNPFNPSTSIGLAVAQSQEVSVDVFNVAGQHVRTLFDGMLEANNKVDILFEANSLPSGVYIYRVAGETFVTSHRVVLMK